MTSGKRLSGTTWRKVFERAKGCCEYCRSQDCYSPDAFSIEHIIPKARGGGNDFDNLALACQGCNGHKADKTRARDPHSRKLVRLFHPRHQKWDDHFAWNEDFTLVVGLTTTGRATVATLNLNRQRLGNLRTVLRILKRHPTE